MDFTKVKLIIWDLDETFWQGTLSEGKVTLPEKNKNLIFQLTDIGIVNSICSKNYEDQVLVELDKYGLSDYFVFKSVNWEPKGNRIKNMIDDMKLRYPNVLFIDDNPSNLEEAKYFCDGIMVESPEIIDELIGWVEKQDKRDSEHKRLRQYKILEEKCISKKNFGYNEEFLFSSNIKLEIHSDCLPKAERIQELIMRSNQLNFTKKRDSLEEIKALLNDDSYKNGYVTVKDNFGDYGLVGFFSVKDDKCIHFLFSCRTLGMGIEQYVYNYLGRPELEIVGEVISDLSSEELPKWINQNIEEKKLDNFSVDNIEKHNVLIKGPCDLYQIFPFIQKSDCIDTEFTYVLENGSTVESTGHTTHIVEALRLSKAQKKKIVDELPFMDMGAYCDNIYHYPYKVVVLSLLSDCNLGVYKRKDSEERFAFLEYTSDMTNPDNYDKLINKKCNVGGFDFTKDFLDKFSEKYEFEGRNTPEKILENLKYIRKNMNPDCALVLMLGTETYYDMGDNPAYKDRHLFHKKMNDLVRKWAETQELVELVDVNKYITGPESYYDHINHFIKPVYYNMAKEIVDLINKYTMNSVKKTGKWKIVYMKLHDYLGNKFYTILRKIRK